MCGGAPCGLPAQQDLDACAQRMSMAPRYSEATAQKESTFSDGLGGLLALLLTGHFQGIEGPQTGNAAQNCRFWFAKGQNKEVEIPRTDNVVKPG